MVTVYGTIPVPSSAPTAKPRRMPSGLVAVGLTLCLTACVLALTGFSSEEPTELLFKQPEHSTELVGIKPPPLPTPWSPPDNLWVYWGPEVDKRESAENVRHTVKMGNIAGGEYRSPHFLLDLDGQKFRDLTLTCCNTVLFPPMMDGYPVWTATGQMQHRISRFVANGNTAIFTGGGIVSSMFINRYFKYNLEPVQGNYSPGPFRKYQAKKLPKQIAALDDMLRQFNTEVTVMHKLSLPVGTQVYFASPGGSPFFSIKYCEVMNPRKGEPPIKVTPPYCPKWKKKGHPCSCGLIVYVGYDWMYADNKKWNWALRRSLTLSIGKEEANNDVQ